MDAEQLAQNPFFVLELRPRAGRADVEQAGQRITTMLELGIAGADRYPTPLGARTRSLDMVRQAMHELRDPALRAAFELWAVLEPRDLNAAPPGTHRLAPWPDAVQDYPW